MEGDVAVEVREIDLEQGDTRVRQSSRRESISAIKRRISVVSCYKNYTWSLVTSKVLNPFCRFLRIHVGHRQTPRCTSGRFAWLEEGPAPSTRLPPTPRRAWLKRYNFSQFAWPNLPVGCRLDRLVRLARECCQPAQLQLMVRIARQISESALKEKVVFFRQETPPNVGGWAAWWTEGNRRRRRKWGGNANTQILNFWGELNRRSKTLPWRMDLILWRWLNHHQWAFPGAVPVDCHWHLRKFQMNCWSMSPDVQMIFEKPSDWPTSSSNSLVV